MKKRGDRIETDHRRLEAFTATVRGEDLEALDADPDVESVSIDAIITANADAESSSNNVEVENLLTASLGLGGRSTTGITSASPSSTQGSRRARISRADGRIASSISRPTAGAAHPYDDYGHGTHVATLIAGEGKGSEVEVTKI